MKDACQIDPEEAEIDQTGREDQTDFRVLLMRAEEYQSDDASREHNE